MTRPIHKLLLGAMTAALVLALGEGLLRLVYPTVARVTLPNRMMEEHLRGATFTYDPELFWYWPSLPVPHTGVNAHGFRREAPMTMEKPPGVTRAIVFGDSQTFGAGLPPDQAYAAVAERALGEGWEVLNAGISGYRTLNVLRLLQVRIEPYAPDVIVIDCMPFDSPRDTGVREGASQYATSWQSRAKALLWHSRIYYSLRLLMEKLNPERSRWLDQAPSRVHHEDLGLGNHDRIATWARDHGAVPLFMTYAVSTEDWGLGCMTEAGVLPDDVAVVDACAALQASGYDAHTLFQDRNHLTELGARVVGEALADGLKAAQGGPSSR
ncbi:MAG: hypothetical protein H6739_40505 [Alphaproteobacteria bacterium]|nr:hypothetical protein [Alphaproteobacteria bacterium]